MSETVLLLNFSGEAIAFYEVKRHESLARIIAEIKGAGFGGNYDPNARQESRLYFVPHYTVVGTEAAADFGMHSIEDLFGGVVPDWFLGTKAITHDLVSPNAAKPRAWQPGFAEAVAPHVLPGFTAFSPSDAYIGGTHLLEVGPVRVKDVFAAGGQGQAVVRSGSGLRKLLDRQLANLKGAEFALVLELDLVDITTYSIGQVYLDRMTVSYWGTQRTTLDNSGKTAYGGSDLTLVRGGLEDVLRIAPDAVSTRAIRAAQIFDAATLAYYPGIFASRRNYDVAAGYDSRGAFRCGVIDQSWRIGGASGVEVLAAGLFKREPDEQVLSGSSFSVYGSDLPVPPDATVHFHGEDPEAGPMLMYTLIDRL